ncbi:MAG: hypothetical protein ACXVEE_42765, partial [Polyangiales bacterium]
MARYGRLFPARAIPDADRPAERLVVQTPRSIYIARGLLSIFLSPVVSGLIVLLMLLMGLDDQTVVLSIAGIVAIFFVLWGIGLLALSSALAAKTVVTFDRATIRRADGASVPTAAVVRVRVKRGGLSGFHVLELVAANGETFAVHTRLPLAPASLSLLANEVAAWLQVPAEAPAPNASPFNENHAAVFCYLPIQGIFLIASLWFIATDQRPFVRFAARQSLLHFAFSIVALVVVLALGATPVFLTGGPSPNLG